MIGLKKRRAEMDEKGKDTKQIDFQIKQAKAQLAIDRAAAGRRAADAQLGDVAGQAAAQEAQALKEKMQELLGQVAKLRGDITAEMGQVQQVFANAPTHWVDAFIGAWQAEAERIVEVVRATMNKIKMQMDPTVRQSPSMVDLWNLSVDTVKSGVDRIGAALRQGMPNVGQLNMSQAAGVQPKGIVPRSTGVGTMRTREFVDNRRVQMEIHNNVDMDDVKRQIGLSLQQVNMGAAEEV